MKNTLIALKRIYIVEDSLSIRARLVEIINDTKTATVIGESETPIDAIREISNMVPDCVIADFRLKGGTCMDILKSIHSKHPNITFIIITNNDALAYKKQCILAGAVACLDKSMEFDQIKTIVSQL